MVGCVVVASGRARLGRFGDPIFRYATRCHFDEFTRGTRTNVIVRGFPQDMIQIVTLSWGTIRTVVRIEKVLRQDPVPTFLGDFLYVGVGDDEEWGILNALNEPVMRTYFVVSSEAGDREAMKLAGRWESHSVMNDPQLNKCLYPITAAELREKGLLPRPEIAELKKGRKGISVFGHMG